MTGVDADGTIVIRTSTRMKVFATILFGGPLALFVFFLSLIVQGQVEGSIFSVLLVVLMFCTSAVLYAFALGESFSQRLEITQASVTFHSLFRIVTMPLKDIDLIILRPRNSRVPGVTIRGAGKTILFMAYGSPDAVIQEQRDAVFGRAVAAGAHVRTTPVTNPIGLKAVPQIAMSYVFGIFVFIGIVAWLHATR